MLSRSRLFPVILAAVLALGTLPASAQSVADGATAELNRHRAVAGLGPVGIDPQSAAPAHARYLALNKGTWATEGLLAHTQQPGLPGYTPEGAAVAEVSNISEGDSSVEGAVRGLIDVPLHRHWMLAPGLSEIGVGGEGGFWVLDLNSALDPWQGNSRVVAYPGPGQIGVPLAFIGHEIPNPLTAIPNLDPNASVGYPISLHFFGCEPEALQASLSDVSGPVPSYLIRPGTVLQAVGGERSVPFVLLFPQQPLQPSTQYGVQMTANCGELGTRNYTWSFTTRAAFNPAAARVAVGARQPDGWQSIAVRLADSTGLPADGAHLTSYRWSYMVSKPDGRPPEARVEQGVSGRDGVIQMGFHLGDAVSAELELNLRYDGVEATLPLTVTPGGNGQLGAQGPAGSFGLDPHARAVWEQAHGVEVVGSIPLPPAPVAPVVPTP